MEMMDLVIAVTSMGAMGLFFAAGLAVADRFLHVEEDPLLEKIKEMLPSANCAGCGEPGCASFAKALLSGDKSPAKCVVLNEEGIVAISGVLGVESKFEEKKIARIFCQGGKSEAKTKGPYEGVKSCVAAQFASGGNKLCDYGCIGYGDCIRACPFEAMYLNENELPAVVDDLCTGCGICADVCPKDIIEMIPRRFNILVLCKNKDKAKQSKAVCSVSCTACNLCVKDANSGYIIENNLARVNLDAFDDPDAITDFRDCPRNVIVNYGDTSEELCEKQPVMA